MPGLGLNFPGEGPSGLGQGSVDQEVSVWNPIFTGQDLDQDTLVIHPDVPDPVAFDLPAFEPANAVVAVENVLALRVVAG